MKNFIILTILLIFSFNQLNAQSNKHQIVFQMVTNDTIAHKAFMKQLNNIYTISPESSIKVVVHGPGLDMVTMKKTVVAKSLQTASERGVVFEICEFSMKERKVEKSEILPFAQFTPAGIIRVVELQESGFHYIKAGF
jgi:intracellular sulfur oxidation DsrE/DsrF family protein